MHYAKLALIVVVLVMNTAVRVTVQAGSQDDDTVQKDVTYCTADGVELKMDIYQPYKRDKRPLPAIMFVHGGGWSNGDKADDDTPQIFQMFADHGFVVASINYRLAPEYVFPAQIEDTKCAVRFLRAKAEQYGLDPERIGAWGASAGGHLVALLGTTDASAKFDGNGGYSDQSSRVQAVADWFGPTDFLAEDIKRLNVKWVKSIFGKTQAELKRASPVTYITEDDPPFLIQQGDKDKQVAVGQSQRFYAQLIVAKVPAELVIVKNAGHGFIADGGVVSPSVEKLLVQILEFFERTLKGKNELVGSNMA